MNLRTLTLSSLLVFLLLGCHSAEKLAEPSAKGEEEIKIARLHKEQVPLKIEFASCAHPRFPQPIWTAMLAQKPDLYLGMGDNVYASKAEDRPVEKMYELQAHLPEFREFRAQVPMLATWDDHDFGESDGGSENSEKEHYKAEFLKFFPDSRERISPQQSGVYHAEILGQAPNTVQVIILDTRYFRSELEKQEHPKGPLDIYQPTQDLKKTFLGPAQWAWLEAELKKPAAFTVILSSVQFIHQNHGFEKWGNFPHERARMISLLRKYKKRNLVFISGDRHQGEIHQLKIKGLGTIYDLTASGINRTSSISSEPSPTRVGTFYSKENFGLLEFDWQKHSVKASLHDIHGQEIQAVTLSISEKN